MKPYLPLIILLGLSLPIHSARAADAEAGLLAITALGKLNGQALACSEMPVAARAKLLMLRHAPKTQRFGTAYEESTQAAFLVQTGSKTVCPESLSFVRSLDDLALQLQATLPVEASK